MTKKRYCVDSNIFITSWNKNYPPDLFSGVWSGLSSKKDQLVLIKPIFDEIDRPVDGDEKMMSPEAFRRKYPLFHWARNHLDASPLDEGAGNLAAELRDRYDAGRGGSGVGLNDIMLVACAKHHGYPVVTLEKEQPNRPFQKNRYKIPAICKAEGVRCLNSFVDLLRDLEFKG